MTTDQKELIQLQFQMLKQTMKKEGLIFGILVDKSNIDNSSIVIMERSAFIEGEQNGLSISLASLNRGLI